MKTTTTTAATNATINHMCDMPSKQGGGIAITEATSGQKWTTTKQKDFDQCIFKSAIATKTKQLAKQSRDKKQQRQQ